LFPLIIVPRVGLRKGRQNFKTRHDYRARVNRLNAESLARRILAAETAKAAAAADPAQPPSPEFRKKGSLPVMAPLSPRNTDNNNI